MCHPKASWANFCALVPAEGTNWDWTNFPWDFNLLSVPISLLQTLETEGKSKYEQRNIMDKTNRSHTLWIVWHHFTALVYMRHTDGVDSGEESRQWHWRRTDIFWPLNNFIIWKYQTLHFPSAHYIPSLFIKSKKTAKISVKRNTRTNLSQLGLRFWQNVLGMKYLGVK